MDLEAVRLVRLSQQSEPRHQVLDDSLFGSGGVARFSILPDDPDFAEEHFHIRTAKAAIEMFRAGNMPVSYDEQLEVAKILTYAKASLLNGGKRYLLSDPPPN